MKIVSALLLGAGVVFSSALGAQSSGMETGWLQLVRGHVGDQIGAKVLEVRTDPETGESTVMVSIPKGSLGDDPYMEEVVVTGQGPRKLQPINLLPDMETEWVDDYDNDHYGLLVKLNSKQKVPFRLFFSSGDGFIDGSVQP
ncbi:MAG: hypothetical protein ACI87W_002794 [Halieaceae bacterium]|jgi:hypothetical protein